MFDSIVSVIEAGLLIFSLVVVAGAGGETQKDNPCGDGVANAEVCEQVVARAPEVARVGQTPNEQTQRKRAGGG